MQDGFQDDSMRMLKNIERSHVNLQVRGVLTWSQYVRIAVKRGPVDESIPAANVVPVDKTKCK
jgi:hypothetical protein